MSNPDTSGKVYVTLLSGSTAACFATFVTVVTQPISRVKFLKQVSESSTKVEQTNIFNIYHSLIKNEGLSLGLFRGSFAACCRNIPQAAVTYSLYPIFYNKIQKHNKNVSPLLNKSLSGAISSMGAHIISHPLDTLRVRIAVQYDVIEYPSMIKTIQLMLKHEGINGFYRGLSVTVLGSIFRAGVGFGIYETFKTNDYFGRLSVGWISGIAATVVAYPFDTVRRRQQVFGKNRNVVSSNIIDIIGGNIQKHVSGVKATQFIYSTEGISGFYKGMTLALFKTPLTIAVSFVTNDIVKSYLGWKS